ncbi:MAG: SDR family NAD(P)-dependent oxidoreductase, partial [Acidobacteriota bacterium]
FDWAIPRFVEARAGHLVGVASMASYVGMPAMPAYCGTKAAMRVHMQGLRAQLKSYGIAVTTICPGFVETELTDRNKGTMPFLWPADRAVRLMTDAIEARRGDVPFPWQMRMILGALSRLPSSITDALVARTASKARPTAEPPMGD